MPVYLVRHAKAGSRHEWHQPDDLRPLTANGERQAEALVEQLGDLPIKRVLSSPSMRCRQTVEPLAEHLGLELELVDGLLEGTDADRVIALITELVDDDVVACSHGDVIPDVVRRLVRRGTDVEGGGGWEKGATWVLDGGDGRITTARYLPPPA